MLITVKPSDGMKVRHPQTGHVISGEIKIEKSPQIIRMLKDKDLVEVKAVTKKAPAKKKQAEEGAE